MTQNNSFDNSILVTVVVSDENVRNHTFVHINFAHIRQQLERLFDTCFGERGAVEAIVTEAIVPGNIGTVMYDRAEWPAEAIDSGTLMAGSKVEVVGHRKNVLQVISCIPNPILT